MIEMNREMFKPFEKNGFRFKKITKLEKDIVFSVYVYIRRYEVNFHVYERSDRLYLIVHIPTKSSEVKCICEEIAAYIVMTYENHPSFRLKFLTGGLRMEIKYYRIEDWKEEVRTALIVLGSLAVLVCLTEMQVHFPTIGLWWFITNNIFSLFQLIFAGMKYVGTTSEPRAMLVARQKISVFGLWFILNAIAFIIGCFL
jgi:hypothetical protein